MATCCPGASCHYAFKGPPGSGSFGVYAALTGPLSCKKDFRFLSTRGGHFPAVRAKDGGAQPTPQLSRPCNPYHHPRRSPHRPLVTDQTRCALRGGTLVSIAKQTIARQLSTDTSATAGNINLQNAEVAARQGVARWPDLAVPNLGLIVVRGESVPLSRFLHIREQGELAKAARSCKGYVVSCRRRKASRT
jgi:hypothetical protein